VSLTNWDKIFNTEILELMASQQLTKARYTEFLEQEVLEPFSDVIVEFFSELSKNLLSQPDIRDFPEAISFAYWIRLSNLATLKSTFLKNKHSRKAQGIALHYAPSNVDTVAFYSFVCSKLMGNKNIVRAPSNTGILFDYLLSSLKNVLEQKKFNKLKKSTLFLNFPKDPDINAFFGSFSDTRLLWGGDTAVQQLSQIPAKPSTLDIKFPNKISICCIHAKKFLEHENKHELTRRFANDSLTFSQQACSSPRAIIWVGSETDTSLASNNWWQLVYEHSKKMHFREAGGERLAVLKTEQYYMLTNKLERVASFQNKISVMRVKNFQNVNLTEHCGLGFFLETTIPNLDDFRHFSIDSLQTIVSFGFCHSSWTDICKNHMNSAPHRIVNIGEALSFSHIWDGKDLFEMLTQQVDVDLIKIG
jgi:hypothetical protein